jgi:hypothetical protein
MKKNNDFLTNLFLTLLPMLFKFALEKIVESFNNEEV